MATRISHKMVPALERRIAGGRIGDIRSVPAATVELVSGASVVGCIGLIDTGADFSVLDENLLKQIGPTAPPSSGKVLVTGFSKKRIPIYHLGLRIRGDCQGEVLTFEKVPVTVTALRRPVFIIGRRGVLERLQVELDFPGNKVTLTLPRMRRTKYPYLAKEFVSLRSIIESIDQGKNTEAMLQLSWELEQFLDRLIKDDESLRKAHDQITTRTPTFAEKLALIETHTPAAGIGQAMRDIANARNQVVHGVAFRTPDKATVEKLLGAAESIVSSVHRFAESL